MIQEKSGFAAVLLNQGFVGDEGIARSIGENLNAYHSSTDSEIAMTVSDENAQVLYSNAAPQNGYFFESNFDRPFSNWKAAVGLREHKS